MPTAPPAQRSGFLERIRSRPITPRRVIKWLVLAVLAWLVLSLVLFIISAELERGNLPSAADAALTSGPNMLFGTDTVLILGTDQRPRTGAGLQGARVQLQRRGQPV